ncbi:MAG TPA: serine/threonine-protein kinase [Archangium sp.]|uniref:serine/threonine-protein kinase n=1 Tax=Archangium sp. TaxID=1872627 RepID=UPI002E309C23|nr:serine/threonine-protein kinase [Archangium sp.]HEX5746668.1 serine/threonine-protein kinase [Archangium sp.]
MNDSPPWPEDKGMETLSLPGRSGNPGAARPRVVPTPGQVLMERYTVLHVLGQGGIGVVLAAYDARLDRRVALKLVRPRPERGTSDELEARLVREAKVMARLNHPHVVSVYDAGTLEDGTVFIAMEYVEGQTLRQWYEQQPRSWREVLAMYLEAGRGLIGAHAVGIIHRDFKPDNVLVGKDGRVRVTDFGVARAAWLPSSTPPPSAPPSAEDWRKTFTLPGLVVGTPRYMAPEVLRGQPADARSDLFSFCVALYEALYAQPAFLGASAAEHAQALLEGRLNPLPARTEVPAWVTRAVLQGLSAESARRTASLGSLLALLEEDPQARLRARLRASALAVGMMALGGLVAWTWGGQQGSTCAGLEGRLAGVWDAQVRTRVGEALRASELPYALQTAERVDSVLEQYASAWVRMSTEVCQQEGSRAPDARGLGLRRVACLERRRGQLRALTELLVQEPDPKLLSGAIEAARALPPLEDCADEAALMAAVPPPEEPVLRARVEELQQQVDRLLVLHEAGRYSEGLTLARQLLPRVEQVDFVPLRARALYAQARLQDGAGDFPGAEARLREAISQAARCGDTVLLAQSWSTLLWVIGPRQGRLQEALGLKLTVESLVELARDDQVRAYAFNNLGIVLRALGRHEEALTWLERTRGLIEKVRGPEHPEVADILNNMGIVLNSLGRYEQALASHQQALRIQEKVLGPGHVHVGPVLNGLGVVFHSLGRYEESLAHSERALAVQERALGPEHPQVATILGNVGLALNALGRHEQALAAYERVLALKQKAFGASSPKTAVALNNLGHTLHGLGRYEEALARYQQAMALHDKAQEHEHPQVATVLNNVGLALNALGRYEQALAAYERSLTLKQKVFGAEHPQVATTLGNTGLTLHALGRYEQAQARLERALAIQQKALGAEHPSGAATLTGLGLVLLARGQHEQAQARLEHALSLKEKVLGPGHPELASTLLGLGELQLARRLPSQAAPPLERALSLARSGDKPLIQLTLARALWDSGGERRRATRLVSLAREAWRALAHPRQAEASRWLASHPSP